MRAIIIEKFYEWSKTPYRCVFKHNEPWPVNIKELSQFEPDSLGFHLAGFLMSHNFDIQPQLEDHDVIHVLTGIGVMVQDEIGMQFYLCGNGKRSAYMYMVMAVGTLFYPTLFCNFRKFYRRGQSANRLHDLNFLQMLKLPIVDIRKSLNIK